MRAVGQKMLDAKSLTDTFGDYPLAKVQLNEVQLVSRWEFEDPDGQRMKRDLWKQIKDHKATWACEARILLSLDKLF